MRSGTAALVGSVPAALLQIGDDDDAAGPLAERFGGAAERGAIAGGAGPAPSAATGAVSAPARSLESGAMTSAPSANATTPTLLPGAAARTISAACALARSNWPGADMLADVSTSTIVAGAAERRRRFGEVRPRERERQQQQRGDTQRQQQHLPQAAPLRRARRARAAGTASR